MKVNEIFYSLQGEGYHTGRAGVFVRFSGCNLRCPFCDTDSQSFREMTEDQVIEEVLKTDRSQSKFVIITGGEPTLQLTESLISKFKKEGYYTAIETNGAFRDPAELGTDWVTLSPKFPFLGKGEGNPVFKKCNELKLVVDLEHINSATLNYFEKNIIAENYFLQPCDQGNEDDNKKILDKTLKLIMQNPKWRLSLQTHKILDIK